LITTLAPCISEATKLPQPLDELTGFPNAKFDDQADSTSQALDWFKQQSMRPVHGILEYYRQEAENMKTGNPSGFDLPSTNRVAFAP
jgi:hypothetical protein